MNLAEYLHKLGTNPEQVLDNRILFLYDTKNKKYFTTVIYPEHIDFDGVTYAFPKRDEPFTDYEQLNVIRAWTITNAVNCMMGLEALTGNYCESEVD